MHGRLKTVLLVLVLTCLATPLQAQVLPWNIGLDSWFGIDFLAARQDALYQHRLIAREHSAEWNPRVPALSGMIEVSPFPFASARLAGSVSVGTSNVEVIRATAAAPGPFRWDLKTDFREWEAAGLWHLWNGGGYRFSVTGGYRRELWLYRGDPRGTQPAGSSLREEFRSDIPFVGLQTAMFFPFWRARFEIQGSWFMTKKVEQTVSRIDAIETVESTGDKGGIIALRMEGETNITPNVTAGLHVRYSHQEFTGSSILTSTVSGSEVAPYRFDFNENVFSFGVHAGVVF
ncbi:MAG: hypothetical protein HY913_01680 [Desulfomonile tiedjei]|nr:hypothetical protein [Desulfomonile tiedjei]